MLLAGEPRELTWSVPVQIAGFSPTAYCEIQASPFFPNSSVGSILACESSTLVPSKLLTSHISQKNIFPCHCGTTFKDARPLIFYKGWLAPVQDCAAARPVSGQAQPLPLQKYQHLLPLCSTDRHWALACRELRAV